MSELNFELIEFASLPEIVGWHARGREAHLALVDGDRRLSYAELDRFVDRAALALQRDGVEKGDVVAICAGTSIEYISVFLGVLRAGAVVAPLAPSSTRDTLLLQLKDCGAKIFFLDAVIAGSIGPALQDLSARTVAFDDSPQAIAFYQWLGSQSGQPKIPKLEPNDPFNIIYSSGTTGAPKGIVQSHGMRWVHIRRAAYPPDAVAIFSTPLYSNTTLVSLLPTLGAGATAVLMRKFDVLEFLDLAEKHRVTHAMLVPVQYRRLLEHSDFDQYDLTSFQMKYATSAPFAASLKAQVLKRWPGGLTELYGMTEGGGTCCLRAHEHPDKLHTVGQPYPGHDIRLVDETGSEVANGQIGEVVGRSPSMMTGYHGQPEKTANAEWWSAAGERYIRTGDLGKFDAEGFLILLDRTKDLIISGGFNVYPKDIESELLAHEAVAEASVVGVPSDKWGETPVAFVVLKAGRKTAASELRDWANGRLGKTQRVAEVWLIDALPRSQIGKVLKREMRDLYERSISSE